MISAEPSYHHTKWVFKSTRFDIRQVVNSTLTILAHVVSGAEHHTTRKQLFPLAHNRNLLAANDLLIRFSNYKALPHCPLPLYRSEQNPNNLW